MLGSRTIKTLTALLVAMTIGAFSLMLLESASVRLNGSIAAVTEPTDDIGKLVMRTEVPLNRLKWRNVVLSARSVLGEDLHGKYHFLIRYDRLSDKAEVIPTPLWKRQAEGDHVRVPGFDYNANSIGICLIGDFQNTRPPGRQYRTLVKLTREIQQVFNISPDYIYLHSNLDRHSSSPGSAFPAESFRTGLLTVSR